MKVKYAALTLALVSLSGAAFAATDTATSDNIDGTVTITGAVVDQTCKVKGDSNNIAVTLPTVNTAQLTTLGQTAGLTHFQIQLTGCGATNGTAAPNNNVGVYFSPSRGIDTTSGTVENAGGTATGVNIQLLNSSKTKIIIGSQVGLDNTLYQALPSSTKDVTFDFYARYFAKTQAKPGTVQATIPFTIVYN